MNKFRNFFYNKSDILVAVIILTVAAAILAWRVDVIMSYPKTLVAEAEQSEEKTETDKSGPSAVTSEGAVGTGTSTSGEDKGDEPEMCGIYVNYGDTIETVASHCISAGLVPDIDTFMQALNSRGAAAAIQAGQHIIPLGVTPDELIDYLVQPGL